MIERDIENVKHEKRNRMGERENIYIERENVKQKKRN